MRNSVPAAAPPHLAFVASPIPRFHIHWSVTARMLLIGGISGGKHRGRQSQRTRAGLTSPALQWLAFVVIWLSLGARVFHAFTPMRQVVSVLG